MKDNSLCKVNKYCGFDTEVFNDEVIVDVCRYCGKKVIYKVVNGKYDEKQYLRDHVRDTCQPEGNTKRQFFEIYGEEGYRENKKNHKDTYQDRLNDDDRKNLIKDAKKYIRQH